MTSSAPSPAPRPGGGVAVAPPPGTSPQAAPRPGGQSRGTQPGGAAAAPVAATASRLRRALVGTPGRMRVLAAVLVLTSLAVGLTLAQVFRNTDASLGYTKANAAQLVRIQDINTSLMRADADATNAFLLGGLEPPQTHADYTASVDRATKLVAEAAQAQPADGRALAALNQVLVDYTSFIETARANNRQGLPIGAQYLRTASDQLRAEGLPLLSNLLDANEQRTSDEADAAGRQVIWVFVAAGVYLVVVLVGSTWLSRRTRRFVNVPVAAGALLLLVLSVFSWSTLLSARETLQKATASSFVLTRDTAAARIAAFDAKSYESLTLISRGSGAAFETSWKKQSATTQQLLAAVDRLAGPGTNSSAAWAAYTTLHTKIRSLDDGGSWNGAVTLATTSGAGGANAAFDAFDSATTTIVTDAGAAFDDQLSGQRGKLPWLGWAGLLAGLAAALSAWFGVAQRLEEYR